MNLNCMLMYILSTSYRILFHLILSCSVRCGEFGICVPRDPHVILQWRGMPATWALLSQMVSARFPSSSDILPLQTHQRKYTMMTSSNGNIFRVTGLCAGNSPVTSEFPTQRPVTRSFDVFFDLRLNRDWSKQWRRCWFQTLPRLFLRHCNARMLPR